MHVGAAEIFDNQADGDRQAGLDDPHSGRVADEESCETLPKSMFLHRDQSIIVLCIHHNPIAEKRRNQAQAGSRHTLPRTLETTRQRRLQV